MQPEIFFLNVLWGTLSFNTLIHGKIEKFCVCVCVYCTFACSSGHYFKKRLKPNYHLTISEALAVHAGVIEKVLIPKLCLFLWNRSPKTEVLDQVMCLVLKHYSSQPAALGPIGLILIMHQAENCSWEELCDLCWI